MNKNVVFGLVFVGILALFLFQNAGAAVPLHIYQENSLSSPWVDTSYTNIRTFNSTEQAYVGLTAIKVANNPWGAFGARSGPWGIHNNIVASQYSVFSAAIYGGAQGVSLQFRLSNDYGNSFPVYNASAPANAWTVFNIPLAVLDPNGFPINGFSIAERSGQARTFYIDEIRFIPTSPLQDILPPLISITAPTSGATVVATVSVSATSTDDTGVVGVQFKLDGNNLGAEDTNAPYEVSWDTTPVSNGSHLITAVARDAAGNSATSTFIAVTVENGTPPASSVKMMLLGDSITELDWQGGYRSQLYLLLNLGGYEFDFVGRKNNNHADANLGFVFPDQYWDHEGYGSATIDNAGSTYIWNQNIGSALAANPPDIVLLMLGTNDVYSGSRTSTQIRANMSAFLDQIWNFNKSISVVLSNIPRTFDGNQSKALLIQQTNALWPGLVSEKQALGRYITLVDNYAAFDVASDTVSDGIHPSPQGYVKMANAWYPKVVPAINGTTTTPPTVDILPPLISITAPTSGATVVATVSVSATSTDDTGVVGVQFKLDGNNLGAEDTNAPYEVSWDTTPVSNGSHLITAVARDAAGNSATSTFIAVTVENLTVAPNVYGDSFVAPWGNASYGGTFDIANTERVAGGIRAIKATANAWGTVRPQTYANPKDVSPYSALEFDVYNTVGTINPLNVFIQAIPGGSGSTVSFALTSAMKPKPVAGQWTHISIPLSLFTSGGKAVNIPGTRVNYINLQNDGTARAFYVDNIRFQ